MSRFILKAANSLLSLIVLISLCVAGTYAAYALWDNRQIYSAAEDVQADMIKLKPVIEDEDSGGASFEELMAINPDVHAWVVLDNTKVDYPVLQGDTNLTYINKDVYGNFALAGSIYLDSRNDSHFSDAYSVLYGHHMEKGSMFGDLDLYKEEAFFEENTTGMLFLPDRAYNLEIFACLVVKASDDYIYEPERWQTDINGLISYAEENSMYLHEEVIEKMKQMSNPQILAFTTCSSEFTDARTIILAAMEPYRAADQEDD
ncbi:MAG: class B sortase [Lachnospiraceae bacterium]|nr:class B sortase [Robinsoniella sp.]MDY3765467.1 class B sortase [Lachnospiraceae bacterium]